MSNYFELIQDFFNEKKLRFFGSKNDYGYSLFIPMNLKNIPGVNVVLDIAESGKCSAYCTIAKGIDSTLQLKLFSQINRANNSFAFASFSFEEDGDLLVSMNFYVNKEAPGKMAFEYIMTFFSIIDDAIPAFLPTIWEYRFDSQMESSIEETDDYDDFSYDKDDFDEEAYNEDDLDEEFDYFADSEDDDSASDEDDSTFYEELFCKKKIS